MDEDLDLKILEQKKLEAMKRRIKASAPQEKVEKTDRDVVLSMLYDRGDEVLETSYSYYPKETEQLVKELAGMVRDGRFREKVSGGELYSIMRQIGLRFRLNTTIKVEDKGKFVDLSEKLGRRKED